KERFFAELLCFGNGIDDLAQSLLVIFFADDLQRFSGFINSPDISQPPRTSRNAEEHHKEEKCRNSRNAELPSPFCRTKTGKSDQVVRKISQQDSQNDIELKESNRRPRHAAGEI